MFANTNKLLLNFYSFFTLTLHLIIIMFSTDEKKKEGKNNGSRKRQSDHLVW